MRASRSDIIQKLQREILSLGGMPSPIQTTGLPGGLAFLKDHFPYGSLPTAAMHEFSGSTHEDMAATGGFVAALLSTCLPLPGAVAWISTEATVFPPALCSFNMEPHQVLFIQPANEKDLLWATEEALKCAGLRAVIAETKDIGAMHSRRFQLAAEKSRVTGFLLNRTRGNPVANNCVSRWKISSLPSETEDGLPGVGHPHWEVELLKIRNGRPGRWTLSWSGAAFLLIQQPIAHLQAEQDHKRTG
jgi:protein ImuA